MKNECLAIIPARGGSKGLPGKNIKKLNGLPLIGYTIRAARATSRISRIAVSTDDKKIGMIAESLGGEFIKRPESMARDDSPIIEAVLHCLDELKDKERYEPESFIMLQPTSPFRESRHIDEAFDIFRRGDCEAVISVLEPSFHPLKSFRVKNGLLEGLVKPEFSFAPRQELPKGYVANGAIFLMKTKSFRKHKSLFAPRTRPYFMGRVESLDVDHIEDFDFASFLLKRKKAKDI